LDASIFAAPHHDREPIGCDDQPRVVSYAHATSCLRSPAHEVPAQGELGPGFRAAIRSLQIGSRCAGARAATGHVSPGRRSSRLGPPTRPATAPNDPAQPCSGTEGSAGVGSRAMTIEIRTIEPGASPALFLA